MSLCLCTCLGTPFGLCSGAFVGSSVIKVQAPARRVCGAGLLFVLLGTACYIPVRLDCRNEDGSWTLWILESDCMDISNGTTTRNDVLAAMAGVAIGWGICLLIASCALHFHVMVPPGQDDETTVASHEPPDMECGVTGATASSPPAEEVERSTEEDDDNDNDDDNDTVDDEIGKNNPLWHCRNSIGEQEQG